MSLVEQEILGKTFHVATRIYWDDKRECLYFVDVPTSTIYCHTPHSQDTTQAQVGKEPLAFAFPTTIDDQFIAGVGRNIVLFTWYSDRKPISNIKVIGEVDQHHHKNRLNGAKIDPFGRLWAGTMGHTDINGITEPDQGALYSVTKGVLKKHDTNITIGNGMAWSIRFKKMYYVDTEFPGIYQYDYDLTSGEITNKTVNFLFSAHKIKGKPDGLEIDKNDHLWLAVIFGALILEINPECGTILRQIHMPTSQITALVWGDPDFSTLYVTTAQMAVNGSVPPHPAGCVFKFTNRETIGLPGYNYIV